VAWIDAPAPIAAKLEMAKQAEDLLTGALDQRVVFEACRRGILDRQLPTLRQHYQAKRDVMIETLEHEFSGRATWPAPKGGFFLWVTLPEIIDADVMITRAVENGVIYVAGDAFFVDNAGKNMIRLSFSQPSHEKIREGVQRLGKTIREEIAARESLAR
jgi:2-aminoadipate transaminase